VELGQVAALAVMVPVVALVFQHVDERVGAAVLSALVAHTGWHWMWERWERVARYSFALGTADLLVILKWVLAGMVVWAIGWLVQRRFA
jgi:predicted transporter